MIAWLGAGTAFAALPVAGVILGAAALGLMAWSIYSAAAEGETAYAAGLAIGGVAIGGIANLPRTPSVVTQARSNPITFRLIDDTNYFLRSGTAAYDNKYTHAGRALTKHPAL